MNLQEYNKKRNFDSTNEPKGNIKKSKKNRFVVQYHEARAKHYDFRLEYKGVLLSWAVPKGLSQNPKDKRLAVKVEDHPVDYINFEGIIPKGNYGAGTVEIYDFGEYLPIKSIGEGLKKGHLKIVLNGNKLKGAWSLIKTKDDNWLVVKIDDEYGKETIKKDKITKLPFKTCGVQLATLSHKIPAGKEWIFEIKYDGYRMISYIENGKVKMFSRNKVDYSKKFGSICESLKKIDRPSFVLDGEIVAFDKKGRSDFGLLQKTIKQGGSDLYYVVFDLLALDGKDLRDLPLLERKAKLERLLFKSDDCIMYSKHVDKGKESFEFAKKNNLEGIIAKKSQSKYSGKRSDDWLKIKCYLRQEFVIGGFTTSDKNQLLSALLLGYYENKKFIYVGKVGTGFSVTTKKELHSMFQKLLRKTSPFSEEVPEKNVYWLKPSLIAEIQFTELTKEKLLRQPSFLGLRRDKEPEDVVLETKQ